ncbi:MAG: aminotransferase class V-fold PLP-dependent enzyme [Planctomycetes bacterium]|nr:aminotransferase class V-fold PLP-dependent enzyme [Planctomycetota bacterium]
MSRQVLLNPGPVNVSERVRAALALPDLCHREAEFFDLQDEVLFLLVSVFGLSAGGHVGTLLTGSGTAALEAAVSSAVSPAGRMLVVDNGVYGDRIRKIARAHGIAHDAIPAPWTERPDLDALRSRLAKERYEVVAAVHHETTTGLINPVIEIGRAAADHGALFLVDSISGLGGEEFDFEATGADLVVGTANKCIQGLPGVSFVLARRDTTPRWAAHPPRSLYLHLPAYMAEQSRRSTPYTPAVQVLSAFREALRELAEETVTGRILRYRRASEYLRGEFSQMRLEFLLPPELRSNTITALSLPAGWTYPDLHDRMKERGFVIYAGQGALSATAFRVANMGWIEPADLARFSSELRKMISCKR